MFHKKTLHKTWYMSGRIVVMKLPITSCPFLWPSESSIQSMEECSSLMQNLMQTHCSALSVILNATSTQCTCSINGIYHSHWLVHHCSHMHIPVHSPWLPGYIDVMQTVLIILTMAELLSRQTYYILIHFLSPPKYHDCPPIVALICLVTNSWSIEHLVKLKHQSFS